MRFYTTQHPFYCGIDLHARTMDVCMLDQGGEVLVHRTMQTDPEAFLKALAPVSTGSRRGSRVPVHLVLAR